MTMREIKFRGKRIDTGEWVYGSLLYNYDEETFISVSGYSHTGTAFSGSYKVLSETVGQYTGLKDKNGTAVWEGDLLLTPERDIMVVEWQDAKLITKCVRPANPRYVNSLAFAYPVSVIIGNIHDNPELLEDGK